MTSNQALITIDDQSLLSDNDSNPDNGINPTIVALDRPDVKSYLATLILNDPSGPPAQISEEVSATIKIENTGNTSLSQLELNLLVDGLIYKTAEISLAVGQIRYEPAPAATQESSSTVGTLYLRDLELEANSQIELKVNLQIDPKLESSRELCLQGKSSSTKAIILKSIKERASS